MEKIELNGIIYVKESDIPAIKDFENTVSSKPSLDLSHLIGEKVTFFCLNYIYHGEVVACDFRGVSLKNPKIVYETGDFEEKGFKNAELVYSDLFRLNHASIESYCILKNKND